MTKSYLDLIVQPETPDNAENRGTRDIAAKGFPVPTSPSSPDPTLKSRKYLFQERSHSFTAKSLLRGKRGSCCLHLARFASFFRLVCALDQSLPARAVSLSLLHLLFAAALVLSGLQTRLVLLDEQAMIWALSWGVSSCGLLFFGVKVPFECMRLRLSAAPTPVAGSLVSPVPAPHFSLQGPAPRRCPWRCVARGTFVGAEVGLLCVGVWEQSLFRVRMSGLWVGGCLALLAVYLLVFEPICGLVVLCFEKDCRRLCRSCLPSRSPSK